MIELPPDLLAALPNGAAPIAYTWWGSLSESDRLRLVDLWDNRLEVSFFSPQVDSAGRVDGWEQMPSVEGGRFVPAENDDRSEWEPGYFEHLLQHPELMLAYEPPRRTFYIGCTHHIAARECLIAGAVPLDFNCPVNNSFCPLESLRNSRLTKRCVRPQPLA